MVYFNCCHCDKEIHDITIMYDKIHFLHEDCEKEFRKQKTFDKWNDTIRDLVGDDWDNEAIESYEKNTTIKVITDKLSK